MRPTILKPKQALNKVFLKEKPLRSHMDAFKQSLITLLDSINEKESEENAKNLVRDFLLDTYYKGEYEINTKDRSDLVIHNDKTAKSTVGVILEAKRPSEKYDFPTKENLNVKATQELVLYYLRERLLEKNTDIKNLVITNGYEWFIIDSSVFYEQIAKNTKLIKEFEKWRAGQKDSSKTELFYKDIAKPFLEKNKVEVPVTYFDIKEYEDALRNDNEEDDKKLIALYKLLSPVHLLKVPFANDSNSLDRNFYAELLHIIGLEEVKDKGKKLIQRKENPDHGSLLESAIYVLEERDKLRLIRNPDRFGSTEKERVFNIALELCITWVNRILFLKLLESQLVAYNKGDKSYRFLNIDTVKDYDKLDTLFFSVLAKKEADRNERVKELFPRIPYLNSSLFEQTDLEAEVLSITALKDDDLAYFGSTVLLDDNKKRRLGKLYTLQYFFEFLDAYDFTSEGSEEIQEDNKTLINASVLGLIFEKINGYKDGSFFTPSFITMYMCRETLRRAVVQKFNKHYGWHCRDMVDLHNEVNDRTEANELINSLKICDPAVGSGHFLVSALNELIAIKSELGLLMDAQGKRLKEYDVEVVNDELIISDEDHDIFEYKRGSKEGQRVQETLFKEKQTLIENCLFGVDINPNSVKICRLRLWIELLKNAYYTKGSGYKELETLPNIDINIKDGNSLISRFDLEDDLKTAFKDSGYTVTDYKNAVKRYKDTNDKVEKLEVLKIINEIKHSFSTIITKKFKERVLKAGSDVQHIEQTHQNLRVFGEKISKAEKDKLKKAKEVYEKRKAEEKQIVNNVIYRNAFEWRFEFPEVLDDKGAYVGFDVVIGNPPYVQLQSIKETSKQLQTLGFETYSSMGDLYALFYERGNHILNNGGTLSYITGSAWMRSNYGQSLRTFFNTKTNLLEVIDLSDCDIFDSATVLTCIISFAKQGGRQSSIRAIRFTRKDQEKLHNLKKEVDVNHTAISGFPESSWIILDPTSHKIKERVESLGKPLRDWDIEINYGIKTGFNDAFVIDLPTKRKLIDADAKSSDLIKPLLRGRDVHRYYYEDSGLFLIGTFPSLDLNINSYSAIKKHLKQFLPKLNQTGETFVNDQGKEEKTRKKTKGEWFETQDSIAYWEDFKKPKIIYPNMTKWLPFSLDLDGNFLNDKCFILSGEKLYYLVAFLNSKLFRFCFSELFPELQGNSKEVKKFILETIPVKGIEDESPFVEIVNEVLDLKKHDHSADASKILKRIDRMIYEHYGLTEEEIKVIEGS